jgi:hypothetical protein
MLSCKEMDRIELLNSKNGYVITDKEFKSLVTKHKKAREKNDTHTMEKIEYRLTDINFHSECRLLKQGKYERAYTWLDRENIKETWRGNKQMYKAYDKNGIEITNNCTLMCDNGAVVKVFWSRGRNDWITVSKGGGSRLLFGLFEDNIKDNCTVLQEENI